MSPELHFTQSSSFFDSTWMDNLVVYFISRALFTIWVLLVTCWNQGLKSAATPAATRNNHYQHDPLDKRLNNEPLNVFKAIRSTRVYGINFNLYQIEAQIATCREMRSSKEAGSNDRLCEEIRKILTIIMLQFSTTYGRGFSEDFYLK